MHLCPKMTSHRGHAHKRELIAANQAITILQINTNRCRDAQLLLLQTASEVRADVVVISEQNKNLPSWYADLNGDAAIAITNGLTPDEVGESGPGFVWLRIKGVRIYSCHVSPNITIDKYRDYLESLEASIRAGNGEVILAGDFNAKSAEWGSTVNETRGDELSALAASLDLLVCNIGKVPTFERGASHSVLDVTFATPLIARRIRDWKVLNEESRSDHKYIKYELSPHVDRPGSVSIGWCRNKVDPTKMRKYIDQQQSPGDVHGLMEIIIGACDATTTRGNNARSHHKPQHWWTPEIAEHRKASLMARRRYQKAARKGPADEEKRTFKEARKVLRIAIWRSQETGWNKSVCRSRPRSLGYAVQNSHEENWKTTTSPFKNDTRNRS